MKCCKHQNMEATRVLEADGERYPLCPDCSWVALMRGERLLALENGKHVHLDENENPVFD